MADISKGDLIRMELTGRLASDGSVFESTDEELAKKAGIWSTASKYGPRLVIFGKGSMIAGLEEAVPKFEVGKENEIDVPPEKAFGKKYTELVRVMNQKEFDKQGVKPTPGLMVTIDGVPALVKSVSSGRIMLDFNHPFAGQELKYKIKMLEIIKEPEKKAEELARQFEAKIDIKEEGGKKKVVILKGIETSKAKGLEAALRACLGNWAEVVIEK
ncbi:MAG: peptidylprolyl isomerase [Candidatus Micrarchaeota archaeon]